MVYPFILRVFSRTERSMAAAARKHLGYQPRVDFEQGIARFASWLESLDGMTQEVSS